MRLNQWRLRGLTLAQNLIRLSKLADLAFQGLHVGRHIRGQPRLRAAVDLGLLDPFMQRARSTADLRCDRRNRRPPRRMFAFMIQNHPHRTGAHLRGKLVRRFACQRSTLAKVGASDNPGAVQTAVTPDACVGCAFIAHHSAGLPRAKVRNPPWHVDAVAGLDIIGASLTLTAETLTAG